VKLSRASTLCFVQYHDRSHQCLYVNDADDNGGTPLMRATATDSMAAVTVLIATGADLEHVDDDGATALLLAVDQNHDSGVSASSCPAILRLSAANSRR
jgi:ankyrin repeat protein